MNSNNTRTALDQIADLLTEALASCPDPGEGVAFGRWTIVAGPVVIASAGGGKRKTHWWVTCSCMSVSRLVPNSHLRDGSSRGCGCERNEIAALVHTKHGRRFTLEYAVWSGMIRRCESPTFRQYRDYGGRGISVCRAWRESFDAFFRDMGKRPSSKHSIDRIDVNGNYEPSNCRWATWSEQRLNRRDTIRKSA